MGNCSGNVTSPADAFKMSIFNPIFNSPDWETFVGMCSIQEFPSVEGEVTAYISNERGQQSQLATYTPGDLIYLAPGFKSSRGTLSCGGYKLFYQMQTLESPVRILSAERRRVDTFLNANPHCAQLAYLFSSSSPIIKDLSALSLFQSMTPEQVQLMLSVMKIARFEAEQVLCHDNNPSTSRSRTASLFPGKSVSILLKGEVELLSPILCAAEGDSTSIKYSKPTVMGLEHCFIHKCPFPAATIMGRNEGLIAYIPMESMNVVFRKDLTLKRILRRNYYFDYLSQHQSRFPLLKELTEGRLRALCKKTRIRGLVPGPLQFMPTQTAFLIFRGQLSLEEDQRAARKSKKWIYNAWTMVGGRGLAMNDYDELFEESSSMANGNPSAAPTALRRHCRYYIQARQPSVIACITTVGLQDAFQNAKEDLSKLFLRLGNTYTSFYHLLYIPDACNHLLAFIRHQSPPSRDAAATNTATAMPTPSLSTISSTPTPSGLSSPSSSRSTRSYNEQDLIFYIAIQRFEDLYLRLQSFATRSLHPRDWRRVVDIYAQREASALRNIEEIIPKPQSFNISSFLGGGGGGLGSLNAQKSLRDLHVTNPSTIPESDGLLSKGTSTPMTPATTMLLRGQTSSRFNLSPSLSMTLGPPSRQSSAAGLVDQDQDMDPNANSSRLSPRHRSSSQDQDSYRDQHSSHQGKVATPMDLEDEIRHSQLEEEEEVRQTSNDAPDRLLDDKVDASIGKFIPVEQAQEILEQQMKEIRSVVKFLIDSFMPLNQSANILNISPDCIEDTQEHAKAFLEQPIGLSLALFFLALVNKYASSSHGGISASTASIGAMDFSVVDMEGHALNEEKRRLMAALQTISSKSAGPGREDTPMIGAEMIFAGAKQEIYGALYQKVYMKWRDGQAFMLFLKEMVPIDDALSKEYGEEGIGEVSSDTSVHFDGRQRRDDSTTNDYSLRPDKKPSHRSFNPLRCFRKGKKNVKQSYVLPDNK